MVGRFDEPLYRFDSIDLALVVVGVAALLTEAALLVTTSRPDVAVLVTLTAALASFGLLAILSVGVLFGVAALIPGTVLVRRLRDQPRHWRTSMLAGGLVALGLATVILTVPRNPLVECHSGGGVTVSGTWRDSSASGFGAESTDETAGGTLRFDGETYAFTCHDGKLVEFETVGRPVGLDAGVHRMALSTGEAGASHRS